MRHTPHNYRPRIPPGLLLAGAVIVLIPIGIILAWLWLQWATLELLYPSVADALRVLLLGTLATAPAVALWAAWRRWATHKYIEADKVISLVDKQRALPAGVQSVSWHDSSRQLPAPPMEETQLALPPPSVPTFAQLLDDGKIGPGHRLVFGFDAETGAALTGDWKDLYSVGIGGLPGSGKTTAAAMLVAQSALSGARLILADPHAGNPESLTTRLAALEPAFVCEPAQTTKEIVAALQLCNDKLRKRAAGQSGQWPLLFICDEWTSLLRTAAAAGLPDLVRNISQEGRKYGIYAILIAQNWGQDQSGRVRDELCSHLVMRTRPELGRWQTGLRAAQLPDDLLQLAPGNGYLLNNRGDVTRLVVPRVADADLARVGTMLQTAVRTPSHPLGFQAPTTALPAITAEATGKRPGSAPVEAASRPAQTVKMVSPEAIRAAALFRQNMSEKAIIKELRGIEGGRGYEAARDEVRNLIVEGLKVQQ